MSRDQDRVVRFKVALEQARKIVATEPPLTSAQLAQLALIISDRNFDKSPSESSAANRQRPTTIDDQQTTLSEHEADWRQKTISGDQIITCEKGYAYSWPVQGVPLQIGDRVLLPGNWLFKESREATVSGFGTDYVGKLQKVLRKLPG